MIWQHIGEANLKLSGLMRERMLLLGYYVTRDGFRVDPMMTVAVQDWSTPSTAKDAN